MPDEKTAAEQQLDAESAVADTDDAKQAAEKRRAALGVAEQPDEAKGKARAKQTTREG